MCNFKLLKVLVLVSVIVTGCARGHDNLWLDGQVPRDAAPAYSYRILNHWDNLDGTVERGFAGHSIWKWETIDTTNIAANNSIYAEYARATGSRNAATCSQSVDSSIARASRSE